MMWIYLMLAIIFEVSGTTSMKLSQGFERLLPSITMVVFYGLSFALLTIAIKSIDIGVAYAIWSGLGTALVAMIGILWFSEPLNALKVVSTVLIILGVVGLHLGGASH
jgi:small multidrug resistance pump